MGEYSSAFSINYAAALTTYMVWIVCIPLMVLVSHRKGWTAGTRPTTYGFSLTVVVLTIDAVFWGGILKIPYFEYYASVLGYLLIFSLAVFTLKKLQTADTQKDQV